MFEKEAEEYSVGKAHEHYNYLFEEHAGSPVDFARWCFQDGAEFGYNKANEWHYPSKGEYPKENKRYLCKIKAFVGGGISYECFDYDIKYNSWKDASGDVIAWIEIVPPELKEGE